MRQRLKRLLGVRAAGLWTRWQVTRRVRGALRALERRRPADAEAVIDFLWSDPMRHVRPCQHREELLELAREIERRRPQVVLEIGTAGGGTLFLAACLAAPEALLISIDLPAGPFGGGYPTWKIPLYRAFAGPAQRIELIRGDSHDAAIAAQLDALLDGRRIDYLFLDGDHRAAGLRQDVETCSTRLAADALVAIHDIVEDRAPVPTHFVAEVWSELRHCHPHREIVRDPAQDKFGIGLLFLRRPD
jgi:predicted O-methyltransferase YrrM